MHSVQILSDRLIWWKLERKAKLGGILSDHRLKLETIPKSRTLKPIGIHKPHYDRTDGEMVNNITRGIMTSYFSLSRSCYGNHNENKSVHFSSAFQFS
ncbi:hypothetical protein AVEN_232331-1 [Araneus ventricosus]|uniref:Uncharacterized protein n=1 Tax=Araneus ventricosus TaxID=182803 RepID=A0A4Y2I8S3_ARAVE|nr:hypothetical protein AVEN_232331-1 [Araneus ventricosus]